MDSNDLPVAVPVTTVAEIEGIAKGALEVALRSKIESDADYEIVADRLKAVKHNLKKVNELEEDEKRPHLDEIAKIRDYYRDSKAQYAKAEAHLKKLLVDYKDRQDRLRREQQRAAEEQARREREKLQKRAEKARASGKLEKAAELATQAETVVAVTVSSEAPKVAGLSFREVWEFEITDETLIPSVYKTVDVEKIGKVVSTMRQAAAEIIPGIKVFSRKIPSSTSKQPEE